MTATASILKFETVDETPTLIPVLITWLYGDKAMIDIIIPTAKDWVVTSHSLIIGESYKASSIFCEKFVFRFYIPELWFNVS